MREVSGGDPGDAVARFACDERFPWRRTLRLARARRSPRGAWTSAGSACSPRRRSGTGA